MELKYLFYLFIEFINPHQQEHENIRQSEALCFQVVCLSVNTMFYESLGNFTKFTTLVPVGTKIRWSDFEIKRSKVKFTTIFKNPLSRPFSHHRTLDGDSLN